MYRIDLMYGEDMSDFNLEWLRCNCFIIVTEDGRGISPDALNELQNLWNKSCVPARGAAVETSHDSSAMTGVPSSSPPSGTSSTGTSLPAIVQNTVTAGAKCRD